MREKTGWPPGLLQDDCKKLSRWLASRLDARHVVRQVCAEIASEAILEKIPRRATKGDAALTMTATEKIREDAC